MGCKTSGRWTKTLTLPSPRGFGRVGAHMANKVVINLATGLEDAERVTIAFLTGGAAVEQGKQVTMFLTKDAVRLALPDHAQGVACDGCPPLERLFQQYVDGGGEL